MRQSFFQTLLKGNHAWPVILHFGVSLCVSCVLYCFSVFLVLDHFFPLALQNKPVSTIVTAEDGTPLRAFSDDLGIWRYPASVDQVSPLYLEALLTYEDRWFYKHPGVNPISILRAMVQNIRAGRIVSGGSTLTMQAARILTGNYPPVNCFRERFNCLMGRLYCSRRRLEKKGGLSCTGGILFKAGHRSFTGKFFQIFRALQLEWHLTKDEILTLYLTHAPFGSNIEGVKTASYTWLGKDARELSHAEAALLAVLPQAPSFYRPDRHPERARRARDKVLDRLESLGMWSKNDVMAAKEEPVIALRFHPPVIAPLAARRLHFDSPDDSLIHTTLDFDLQVHVEEIVRNYVSALFPSSAASSMQALSGAALIVNHKTLDVKAYVGSADFTSTRGRGHVDMIKASRSPGSTLKPFLYGAAMDDGLIHSHSLLIDTPRYGAAYEPGNFTGGFMGPVSAASALRDSLNVPAVQLLEAYGPQRFHDRLKNAGAALEFEGRPNLSMILGGVGTDLESLLTLYTALAREGLSGKPRLRKDDPVIERYLLSPGAAWIIMQILTRPMPGYEGINRLAGHGAAAWKTGTSYGFRDAWAMGIAGEYVAGVWVGRPDGTPVPGHYGAVTALPLLKRIFEALPMSDFRLKKPENVQKTRICWPLGNAFNKPYSSVMESRPGTLKSPENCLKKHEAWILDGQIPPTLIQGYPEQSSIMKTFWINSLGQRAQPSCGGVEKISIALWPESVEPWLPPQWQRRNRVPPASPRCPDLAPLPENQLQIISVGDGSVLSRPPGQASLPSIPLKIIGSNDTVHWFLNREPVAVIKNGQTGTLPMPLPGRYQLAAADESGRSDVVEFSVIATTQK